MDATLADPPPIFSATSFFSLLSVLVILITAWSLSVRLLPTQSTVKTRVLFVWHLFDALVHFTLEAAFLYNCFTVSAPIPSYSELETTEYFPLPMTPHGVFFRGQPNKLYGSFYGQSLTAKLWQEYAKADRRWGGSDLTIISLELLTVGVMAPLAIAVCYFLRQGDRAAAQAWICMIAIATGELYGGFMTFCPEWLSGSPNLDTSNFMYLYLYLSFFNLLWVWFPMWVLYEAWFAVSGAFTAASAGGYATLTSRATGKGGRASDGVNSKKKN